MADIFGELREGIAASVTRHLKTLLETKHLYQRIEVDVTAPVERAVAALEATKTASHNMIVHSARSEHHRAWVPIDPIDRTQYNDNRIRFKCPDIKIFCDHCDRVEAFNRISADDFLARAGQVDGFVTLQRRVQVYALSYLCQSCKGVPTTFLVRREGSKLILSGRSPIENVSVPPVIPEKVRRWYRGAVVAHQSGETLAGNFLLRTLIEQWARHVTGRADYADQVIDAYVETLPPDFKARFPVLRETYADLSADIHSATGSEVAFDKATGELHRHFDARRLFEIPTP